VLLGLTLWAQELLLLQAVPTVVQACILQLWLLPWQVRARTARLGPTSQALACLLLLDVPTVGLACIPPLWGLLQL
jgi:hypothetical protein